MTLPDTFSDELLKQARPNLAWTVEQIDLFDRLVPRGPTRFDLEVPMVGRSGVALSGQLVASHAADGTWLWAWANNGIADTPGTAAALELRAIGERQGIPELTTPLLDLSGFPDARSAADHLLLICVGLLDGRGAAVTAVNERGWAFLVVDDPTVPRAEPRPERLAHALRYGSALLPGAGPKAVQGWFARHDVEPEYGPGTVAGTLPDGDRVTVWLGDGGAVVNVEVSGPDGGVPLSASAPEQRLIDPRPDPRSLHRLFPAELLPVVTREIAFSLRDTRGMVEYAGEYLAFDGRAPWWDAEAGLLMFPGGALACRPLGRYSPEELWFEWAPGTEDVREALRRAAGLPDGVDLPELADRLDLRPYAAPESVAVALARTGARVSGRVFTSVGDRFLAVEDPRLPAPAVNPEVAAEEVRAGASWLRGLTPPEDRPRVMREAAVAYFERAGMQVWHHGEPDFLSGVTGLYEVRVFFAPDGTVTDTSWGMAAAPRP